MRITFAWGQMNAYCISVPNQKIILILQRQGDDRITFGTMDKEKTGKERQGTNKQQH